MTEEEKKTEEPVPGKKEESAPEENYKDKYLRALAEQENMRKRIQKEKHEMISFGIENAIAEFLPAIDNFENALHFADNGSDEVKNWAVGFQMILSNFKEILHNHGIVSYHSKGNSFDPEFHEAVEIVETEDHPDGSVIHEFAKGYKSSSRTIRPARVKVAKHPQLRKAEEEMPEEEELKTKRD